MARQWRIPVEKRREIVSRYSQGFALREVARDVGVNYKTARRVVDDAGLDVRGARPGQASALHRQRSAVARWYGWHADQVAEELAKGRSVDEIATEAGFAPDLLRPYLAATGPAPV